MITLTTPTQVTASGLVAAGLSSETDGIAGVSKFVVDFLGNIVTFELVLGQLLNGNVNIGIYPPRISVTVDLVSGNWTSTNGKSGNILPANLAGIISQFKSDRNVMESFSAGASGILPGIQVVWT